MSLPPTVQAIADQCTQLQTDTATLRNLITQAVVAQTLDLQYAAQLDASAVGALAILQGIQDRMTGKTA